MVPLACITVDYRARSGWRGMPCDSRTDEMFIKSLLSHGKGWGHTSIIPIVVPNVTRGDASHDPIGIRYPTS